MKTVRDACQLQPDALSVKLSNLITEGIARLAGASSQAVFDLKQAMGGGKTHLLVGFGLLARHAAVRATYCAGMAHASSFQGAAIAAFNGRNSPDQRLG